MIQKTKWTNIITTLFILYAPYYLYQYRGKRVPERSGSFIAITFLLALPYFIFNVLHYILLQRFLGATFPYEKLRLKHTKKIERTARWLGTDFAPDWIKHQYAFVLSTFCLLITIVVRLLIPRITPHLSKEILTIIEQILEQLGIDLAHPAISYFIFFFALYSLILTILLTLFSRQILNKPIMQTITANFSASIISFAVICIYFITLATFSSYEIFRSVDTHNLAYGETVN